MKSWRAYRSKYDKRTLPVVRYNANIVKEDGVSFIYYTVNGELKRERMQNETNQRKSR